MFVGDENGPLPVLERKGVGGKGILQEEMRRNRKQTKALDK
jgi:hypothetical protein